MLQAAFISLLLLHRSRLMAVILLSDTLKIGDSCEVHLTLQAALDIDAQVSDGGSFHEQDAFEAIPSYRSQGSWYHSTYHEANLFFMTWDKSEIYHNPKRHIMAHFVPKYGSPVNISL